MMPKAPSAPSDVRRRLLGFTLLEVMVAVAILSIALVAIFSSEAGAVRVGARARYMTTGTLLARCKMAEIEEQMSRDGMPAVSEDGEDECCEGGEQEGFSCEWTVERVELPDSLDTGEDLLTGGDDGDGAGPADIESALMGGGSDAVGSYAIQYAFPVLRPAIEEQVRRATVTVKWQEGSSERSFNVVQYLVADQGSATDPLLDPANGAGGASGGGAAPPGQPPIQLPRGGIQR